MILYDSYISGSLGVSGSIGIGTNSPSSSLYIFSPQQNNFASASGLKIEQNYISSSQNGYISSGIELLTNNGSVAWSQGAIIGNVGVPGDINSYPGGLGFWTKPSGTSTTALTERMRITHTGNVGIGTTTPIASLDLRGTQTASGAIARSILRISSLSASANSDTLIGLDINPTFNTGSFTGVSRTAIRFPNQSFFQSANTAGTYYNLFGVDVNNFVNFGNANLNATFVGGQLGFSGNTLFFGKGDGTIYLRTDLLTTGNTSFGRGSFSLPENGYRVQIYGTGSISGSLYISGSASQTLVKIDSDVSSSILFVTGSGNVGIGTNNPIQRLHVVSNNASNNGISIQNLNGSGNSQIKFVNSSGTERAAITYLNGSDSVFHYTAVGGNLLNLVGTNIGIGTTSISARLQIVGTGATSATTTFLLQNSTPTTLMTVLDNGQFTYTTPTMTLAASQSAYVISPIITASNAIGGNYYGVNITPTFYQTTASQTQTAFRVASTFSQSSAVATLGTNIIADFGATSVGSQLTVTDVTSGSIYMVNDVSGLPIIEATSDWNVNIYNFPNIILQKTGSQVNINGTLRVSGSFILPLSQSVVPQTGSAYWSGSLLFIYDGTRYRSSSFA